MNLRVVHQRPVYDGYDEREHRRYRIQDPIEFMDLARLGLPLHFDCVGKEWKR